MAGGDDEVRAHIESIDARTQRDLERLGEALSGRSWPGGASDRSEPAARNWLRLWKASGPAPIPPPCGCASGRCLVCN